MSEQFKTCAAKSQSIDDPAQTKINCNLTAQEPCNVNNLQMPAEVRPKIKHPQNKTIPYSLKFPHNRFRLLNQLLKTSMRKC